MPVRNAPRIGVRNLCDDSGAPIEVLPDYITADFMRTTFRKDRKELKVDAHLGVITVAPTLVRAQIPYLVTLYVQRSLLVREEMEWLVYAPGDLKSASTTALTMWKRWFKPRKDPDGAPSGIAMELDYPLVRDGVLVEPIDDNFFDECWRYVSKRPHKAAGHPDQPWLFTCLDEGFKIYNHTDRQAGLIHRIR